MVFSHELKKCKYLIFPEATRSTKHIYMFFFFKCILAVLIYNDKIKTRNVLCKYFFNNIALRYKFVVDLESSQLIFLCVIFY